MEVQERTVSPRAARSAEAWMLGREPDKPRLVMEPVKRGNSKSVLQRYPPGLAVERRNRELSTTSSTTTTMMMQSMPNANVVNRSVAEMRARSISPPSIRKITRQAPTPETLASTPSSSPARRLPSSPFASGAPMQLSFAPLPHTPPISPLHSPKGSYRSKRKDSATNPRTHDIPPSSKAKKSVVTRSAENVSSTIPPSPLPASHVSCIKSTFSDSVDLYRDVLGVSRMASPRHLRIAYFRKGRVVLEENLSRNKQKHFQALSMAYEILSNAEWKDYYDAYGLIAGTNVIKPPTPRRNPPGSPNHKLLAAQGRMSLRSLQKTDSLKSSGASNSPPGIKLTRATAVTPSSPGMDEESRDAWEEARKEEEDQESATKTTTPTITIPTIAPKSKMAARVDNDNSNSNNNKRWMDEFDVGSWKNLEDEGYTTTKKKSHQQKQQPLHSNNNLGTVGESDGTVPSDIVEDCSLEQEQIHQQYQRSKSVMDDYDDDLTEDKHQPPVDVITPTRQRRPDSSPSTPVASPTTILRKSTGAKGSPPRSNAATPVGVTEEDVKSIKSADSILKKPCSPRRNQNRIRWNEEVEELLYQAHPDEHLPPEEEDEEDEDEVGVNPLKNFDESFVKNFWTDLEKSMDGLENSIDGWMRYWSDDALDGKIIKTQSQDSSCTENSEISRKSSEDSSKSGALEVGATEILCQPSSKAVVKKSRKLKHKSNDKPIDPEKDLEDDISRELYAEMTKPVPKEILDQVMEKKKRTKFKSFVKKLSAKKAAEEKEKGSDAIMVVEAPSKWDSDTISTMSASEMTPFLVTKRPLAPHAVVQIVPQPEPTPSSAASTSTPDMGNNPLHFCTGGGAKVGCETAKGPSRKEESESDDGDFFSYLSTYMNSLKDEFSKLGTHVSNLDWEKANKLVIDSFTVPEDDVQGMLDVLSKEMDTEESVAMSRSYTY